MNPSRWTVVIGSAVLGLIAVAVSVLIGGGWALILLEVAGAGLVVVLLLRGQREEDLKTDDE